MSKGELKFLDQQKTNQELKKNEKELSDIKNLYDKRYSNEELGKLTPYLLRFDPEYLIVPGEERVFFAGFKDMKDSNPMIQQLNSIGKKIELWKKLRDGDDLDNIPREIRDAYEKKEPLVIEAVDFGCGDGRSLELWQKMADELKELGLVLKVKFYDVSEVGLKSLISRLTTPVLPERYSDSLKEVYGKKILEEKFQESNFPTHKDIDKLKRFYGKQIYKNKLESGDLSISNEKTGNDEGNYQANDGRNKLELEEIYGKEEYIRRKNLLDDRVELSQKNLNEDDKSKLEKFYSSKKIEERTKQIKLLNNFNNFLQKKLSEDYLNDQTNGLLSEDSTLEMEDIESKMEQQLENIREELSLKLEKEIITKNDRELKIKEKLNNYIEEQKEIFTKLIETYEKIFLEEDLRNLAKIFKKEDSYYSEINSSGYSEDSKNNRSLLIEEYGNEYWETRENKEHLTKNDIKNLENIYGKESFERRIRRDDFPTVKDYEELSKIYGDDEICKLKEKMPKFIEIDYATKFKEENSVTCLGAYKYRNLEAEILLGSAERTSPDDFKKVVGEVDMSLILYGSTSHIPDKELRKEFIKSIIEITTGSLVATLPGKQGRKEEVAKAIAEGGDGSEIKIRAAEFKDDSKTMPYGVYDYKSLKTLVNKIYDEIEEDKKTSIDRDKIKVDVATKRNPADISKNWTDYVMDFILTPVANASLEIPCVSDSVKDARYFGVVAPGASPKASVKAESISPLHIEKKENEL